MKKTVALIDKLLALARGEALPAGSLKGDWFLDMQEEGILVTISHGSRRSLRARDESSLRSYVADRYDIRELEACRELLLSEETSRAAQVSVTGNSKFTAHRTFKGFLVNCYHPIAATLHGESFMIAPPEGTYIFISDYEAFSIPADVLIIGVENAENFRYISCQRTLFESGVYSGTDILFVCRYPQSGDLVRWLQSIPNRYVHFGDLDLAGVHIYLSEYYRCLGNRASLLIPGDYEARIQNGALERYNLQYQKFKNMEIADDRVMPLVDCIHKYHRGYDQEGYIEYEV